MMRSGIWLSEVLKSEFDFFSFKVKVIGGSLSANLIFFFLISLFKFSIKTVGGGPTASHFFSTAKKSNQKMP